MANRKKRFELYWAETGKASFLMHKHDVSRDLPCFSFGILPEKLPLLS